MFSQRAGPRLRRRGAIRWALVVVGLVASLAVAGGVPASQARAARAPVPPAAATTVTIPPLTINWPILTLTA